MRKLQLYEGSINRVLCAQLPRCIIIATITTITITIIIIITILAMICATVYRASWAHYRLRFALSFAFFCIEIFFHFPQKHVFTLLLCIMNKIYTDVKITFGQIHFLRKFSRRE